MRTFFSAALLGLVLSAFQSASGFADDETVTTASWYQCCERTANGERFDPDGLTAAHRTLPFDTRVRVTNTANNRSVIVRINDRGPFTGDRGIDLSRGAARAIGCIESGTCRVSIDVL